MSEIDLNLLRTIVNQHSRDIKKISNILEDIKKQLREITSKLNKLDNNPPGPPPDFLMDLLQGKKR